MQWATSLVTLTPTSGPCFIDEAKLNNYPQSKHTDTHTQTQTHITSKLFSHLNSKTASGHSGLVVVQSCLFTHVAHNRFSFDEGWVDCAGGKRLDAHLLAVNFSYGYLHTGSTGRCTYCVLGGLDTSFGAAVYGSMYGSGCTAKATGEHFGIK